MSNHGQHPIGERQYRGRSICPMSFLMLLFLNLSIIQPMALLIKTQDWNFSAKMLLCKHCNEGLMAGAELEDSHALHVS